MSDISDSQNRSHFEAIIFFGLRFELVFFTKLEHESEVDVTDVEQATARSPVQPQGISFSLSPTPPTNEVARLQTILAVDARTVPDHDFMDI
ncbi:hypothetical protein L484_018579 [Morus notabilis]|uniref:Uncharacterized protein n=1 Tax=Morus notabilis TaxID=981085 RepID=W9RF47_9ROSA|nr:hypothetical protein L484_018579 [Morus notabilis]